MTLDALRGKDDISYSVRNIIFKSRLPEADAELAHAGIERRRIDSQTLRGPAGALDSACCRLENGLDVSAFDLLEGCVLIMELRAGS